MQPVGPKKCRTGWTLGQRLQHIGWDVIDGCWVCRSRTINVVGQPTRTTRRCAWLAWKGELADGDRVVTTCGTPLCVNPSHLFVKDKRWYFADLAAASASARRVVNEPPKLRRRLSTVERFEVDEQMRAARRKLTNGRITREQFEVEVQGVQRHIEALVWGQRV